MSYFLRIDNRVESILTSINANAGASYVELRFVLIASLPCVKINAITFISALSDLGAKQCSLSYCCFPVAL